MAWWWVDVWWWSAFNEGEGLLASGEFMSENV